MDTLRVLMLEFACENTEVAFRTSVSKNRLKRIFDISSKNDMKVVKSVMDVKFLEMEGWPRDNSCIALVFVENLLIIENSKSEVLNVALFWIHPSFHNNLVSEVDKRSLAFWAAGDAVRRVGGVEVSVFNALDRRHRVLLDFTSKLVRFGRNKMVARARFKLPNMAALNLPIEPVPIWWLEIRESALEAYNYLWHGWANAEAARLEAPKMVAEQGSL
ncbi:hypothetical protein KI387_025694, partial [Taxus chinensis]